MKKILIMLVLSVNIFCFNNAWNFYWNTKVMEWAITGGETEQQEEPYYNPEETETVNNVLDEEDIPDKIEMIDVENYEEAQEVIKQIKEQHTHYVINIHEESNNNTAFIALLCTALIFAIVFIIIILHDVHTRDSTKNKQDCSVCFYKYRSDKIK